MLMTGATTDDITLLVKQNVRLARKAAGLTQDDLAEKLGVDRRHVSRWEIGPVRPSEQSLQALADVLDKSSFLWFFQPHENGDES